MSISTCERSATNQAIHTDKVVIHKWFVAVTAAAAAAAAAEN